MSDRKIVIGSCCSCPYISYNYKGSNYDYCRNYGEVIDSRLTSNYSFPDFCKLEKD